MGATVKQFRKRSAILTCLRQSKEHPSAEMVHASLRDSHPDISLATVYRNLAWFRSQGMIQSLGAVEGTERFDACTEPHAHFICTNCGSVMDFPQVPLPYEQGREAGAAAGYQVLNCQLVYTGLCQNCRSRESELLI